MKTDRSNASLILTHSVLVGLTPLIPIPFLDDIVKSYFQRRLVRRLATEHGRDLDGATARTLADDADSGCLLGCLGTVIVYPFKKLLRKILIFLEWKRAVDLTSRTYHHGILVDHILESGALDRTHAPSEIRRAMEAAIAGTPTRPVEDSVRTTFRQSKRALTSAASLVSNALKGTPPKTDPDDVADTLESIEKEEEREIEGVVSKLGERIGSIPDDHFDRLIALFERAIDAPAIPDDGSPRSS